MTDFESTASADTEQAGRWRRLARATGIAGLAFPVLTLTPIIMASTAGEPDFNGDREAVLAFFQATSSSAPDFGIFVTIVGILTAVWFGIGLAFLLGRAEGTPAWRSAVAAASVAMFAVLALTGPWEAAQHRARELDPDVGLFAFDLGNLAFANSWVAIGSFLLCCGWVIVSTRCLPRWLGWIAVVGGIGMALSRVWWTSSIWLAPYLLFWVFVVAVAIWLLRHPEY